MLWLDRERRRHRVRGSHLSEKGMIRTDTLMSQINTYRGSSRRRSGRTSVRPERCSERRECSKLSSQLCRQMVVLLGI